MENELCCPAEITADKGKKPAYTVNSPYDADTVYFEKKHNMFPTAITTAAVSFAAAAASAVMGYFLITIAAALVFVSTVITLLTAKASSKRIYENLYKDEALRLYSFYGSHFTAESRQGAVYIEYNKLKKVIYAEKYIMLIMPSGVSYTIAKSCIENASFAEFLKGKTADTTKG